MMKYYRALATNILAAAALLILLVTFSVQASSKRAHNLREGLLAECKYDHKFKIVIVGDTMTGKSHLMNSFIHGDMPYSGPATIGVDFSGRTIMINGTNVKMQIWDTAGQERFRSITSTYYRSAKGLLIVYDVTNETSFQNVQRWLTEFDDNNTENVPKLLVGNKIDLINSLSDIGRPYKRKVTTAQGQELANSIGASFMEASAIDQESVHSVFAKMATIIMESNGIMTQPIRSAALGGKKLTLGAPRRIAKCHSCNL